MGTATGVEDFPEAAGTVRAGEWISGVRPVGRIEKLRAELETGTLLLAAIKPGFKSRRRGCR
jgi:hypothetical protein